MKPDPNIDYSHPVCRMNVAINCKYGKLEICSACDTCGWNPEVSERRIEEMRGEDPETIKQI